MAPESEPENEWNWTETSERVVFSRATEIHKVLTHYVNVFNWKGKVHINLDLLYIAVKSYFDDLDRWRNYSKSDRAGNDKKAAYTMKWFTRIQPLQIVSKETNQDGLLLTCNEICSLLLGLAHLNLKSGNKIKKEYLHQLYYALRYRFILGKQLSREMYLLETIH